MVGWNENNVLWGSSHASTQHWVQSGDTVMHDLVRKAH